MTEVILDVDMEDTPTQAKDEGGKIKPAGGAMAGVKGGTEIRRIGGLRKEALPVLQGLNLETAVVLDRCMQSAACQAGTQPTQAAGHAIDACLPFVRIGAATIEESAIEHHEVCPDLGGPVVHCFDVRQRPFQRTIILTVKATSMASSQPQTETAQFYRDLPWRYLGGLHMHPPFDHHQLDDSESGISGKAEYPTPVAFGKTDGAETGCHGAESLRMSVQPELIRKCPGVPETCVFVHGGTLNCMAIIPLPQVRWAEPNRFPIGWRFPAHSHATVNELHLVLAGRLHSVIDGRDLVSAPGMAVVYPAGCKHADAVLSSTEVRTLYVCWSGGPPLAGFPAQVRDGASHLQEGLRWIAELFSMRGLAAAAAMDALLAAVLDGYAHAGKNSETLAERLQHHLRDRLQQPASLASLARAMHMGRSAFARAFRSETGDTPMRWLRRRRVDRARHLLITTNDTLDAIARQVGFRDRFHCSRAVRSETGIPPRRIRRG